jgi:tetratricopeptide (TPR) repeat protein
MQQQEELQEALAHYEKAVEINPNYAIVYTWMGIIDSALGHYRDNLAKTEMALRLDPLSIANWKYLLALIVRDRMDDVDRHLEKFIAIFPSFEPTLRGLRSSLGGKWTDYVIGRMDDLQKDPNKVFTRKTLSGLFATLSLEKEALGIYDSPMPFVLRWLGKPEHALEVAQARVDEDPMSVRDRRALGLTLASAGDCIRAQPILEEMWQLSDGRITYDSGLFEVTEAVALIICRRIAAEDVDDIVTTIRDNVRRYRDAGMTRADSLHHEVSVDYEDGLVEFLTGEREKGLELIAKAVEDGFFIPPNDAYLQVLYDDPGFAPIRAMQEARQTRERNRFLAIVCIDNPYEEVWQPVEGTCERFAAERGN